MNAKTKQKALTDEQINIVREELSTIIKDEVITQALISRQTSLNAGKLSDFLNEKYTGNNSDVAITLSKWMKSHKEKQERQPVMPKVPDFYKTETSEKIIAKITQAQMQSDIAFIHGASGVGKTATLKHYQDTRPNVWMVTMRPSSSTLMACVVQIADAMGLTGYPNNSYKISQEIESHLENSHGLLIIDEAQNPSVQSLDEIRSWHDNTGVGIAFSGNSRAWTRFNKGNKESQELDRLRSRFGAPLKIMKPTPKDVEALIQAWEIKNPSAHKIINEVAINDGGHMRSASKLIENAYMRSEKPDAKLLKHIWLGMKGGV